jgi:hypothetical protein
VCGGPWRRGGCRSAGPVLEQGIAFLFEHAADDRTGPPRAPAHHLLGEDVDLPASRQSSYSTSATRAVRVFRRWPVDPHSVTSIGFLLAEKKPGPFVLEVAWIKVLRGPAR